MLWKDTAASPPFPIYSRDNTNLLYILQYVLVHFLLILFHLDHIIDVVKWNRTTRARDRKLQFRSFEVPARLTTWLAVHCAICAIWTNQLLLNFNIERENEMYNKLHVSFMVLISGKRKRFLKKIWKNKKISHMVHVYFSKFSFNSKIWYNCNMGPFSIYL